MLTIVLTAECQLFDLRLMILFFVVIVTLHYGHLYRH